MATLPEEQRTMHGKALSDAVKDGHIDAVPGDDNAHAHSHAAHLGNTGTLHLAPEGVGKQGREAGSLNQPPQDPTRNGKTHTRE
jgi:hypothetical protein